MADFKERLAKSQAKMDEVKAKIDDAAETAKIAGMLTKDKIDEQIDSVKGDINAGAESARLAAEKGKSKFNSALLKAQMSIESAKASIAEKKEAHDKAAQENRILDLLDYADECQALALALTVESKLAILEAAAESIDYDEKYNS